MRLGDFLISLNLITERELIEGLTRQMSSGGSLGECLILVGCITEPELLRALAMFFKVDYAETLDANWFTPDCLRLLPHTIARKKGMLVGETPAGLTVFFNEGQPSNIEIRDHQGQRIDQFALAKLSQIRQGQEAYSKIQILG